MIKRIFLYFKTRKNVPHQAHGTYQDAATVGVLYNADEFDKNVITQVIATLQKDNKKVSQLGFHKKWKETNESKSLFSRRHISATGEIKSEKIRAFTHQHFDFLVSLDTSENQNFRYVLHQSKAKCKVGIEAPTYRNILLMSLSTESENMPPVENLVRYLKMI